MSEKKLKTSEEIIIRLIEGFGFKNQVELAEYLGMTPQNISNKKRTMLNNYLFELIKRALEEDMNLNWLFTGKGKSKSSEECPFVDKEKALRIKNDLAYIETTDPGEYRWLREKIMGKAEDLRFDEKREKKKIS